MQDQRSAKINNAKELLQTVKHASLATTNYDGTPHSSPLYFTFSPDLRIGYWFSNPNARHSQNIARTGNVFIVLYRHDKGGGLFIRAEKAHELSGDELERAVQLYNAAATKHNRNPVVLHKVSGDFPQRMYAAKLMQFWVNVSTKDKDGDFINDERVEIHASELLK